MIQKYCIKSIKSILLLFVLIYGLNPAFTMEPLLSDPTENLSRLKQFQQKIFFEPSKEWKKELKGKMQRELSSHQSKTLTSLHAVEGMAEVAEILATMPISSNVHRIGFMDFDKTLIFEALGWVHCCLSKSPENQWDHAVQLILSYGFTSLDEFKKWGNTNFPTPNVKGANFYHYHSVINPVIPRILENWYSQGMNIFGLTSRDYKEESYRAYTQQSLKEVGVDFKGLSRLSLDNNEIKSVSHPYLDSNILKFISHPYIDSGIIYSSPIYGKFGTNGAGIKFLDGYLEKLSKTQFPLPSIEVLVVDDCNLISLEITDSSNINALQKLGMKFNTEISLRYFQPYEHHWLCPYEYWDNLGAYGWDFDQNKIALQALQGFLETFKDAP